jgi:hypothetical protein
MRTTTLISYVVLLLLLGSAHPLAAPAADQLTQIPAAKDEPDIQWFREQLQIAPKYQQQEKGVLGMTWSHFLIMLFLVLFFFSALLMYFQRIRRTRQIIDTLLKEGDHGNNG